ncbi:MAG: hypothetical protein JW940_04530 [Polyangiaceae bacterium]|nr:hypothetical protein [Polyangiaceae bacterium]
MTRLLGRVVAGTVALALLGGCSSSAPPGTFGTGGTTQGTGGGSGIPCSPGMAYCSGVCVIPNDANNCGGCGIQCATGQVCMNGTCTTSCGTLRLCGSSCVDPMTNALNCGDCNIACPSGQCANGQCVPVSGGSGGTTGMNTGGATGMNTGGATGMNTGGATGMNTGGATGMNTGGTTSVGGRTGTTGGTTGSPGGTTSVGGTTGNPGGTSGNPGGTSGTTGGTTGTNTGGTGNVSTGDPPGYVHWGSDWAGCAWTGKDTLKVGSNTVDGNTITLTQATTISPQDFTGMQSGDNFCAKGTVGDAYEAVALLGFNITEPAAGADCSYDPNAAEQKADPGVPPSAGMKGIAVNISSNVASSLRIQIQGPDGGTDANDRWCYDLNASGSGGGEKLFAPYAEFNTTCWDGKGNDYNNEPISAVVFLVPGTPAPTPYEYCVIGFAEGNAASDAPDGHVDLGATKGTIGGGCSDTTEDLDYQRKRVTVDGKQYIIQNNNWGSWQSSCQTLEFEGNSFTVTQSTGTSPDGAAPASFPSIYVGRNGDTANGTMTTAATDHLPKTIGSITSAKTTFAWSGSSGGDFNVSYDVWFAADNPPNGGAMYEDAVSGFIMLWLYDPSSRQPVGSDSGQDATLCGKSWSVWAGDRGASAGLPAGRPVISYVANSTLQSIDCDLKEFMQDASTKSYNGMQLSSSWYLTDVFAGFEMWTGTTGLKASNFTVDVLP